MSFREERRRMLTKDIKGNLGPCLITFSIPLLIPGITLTVVAIGGDEPGISKYGTIHILGIVVLVASILMFIIGCVFRYAFKTIQISPVIDEVHRVVTTHDKLNLSGNNSNDYHIQRVKNNSSDNMRNIYQNNEGYQQHQPSTSSSSSTKTRSEQSTKRSKISEMRSKKAESNISNDNNIYDQSQENSKINKSIKNENNNTEEKSSDIAALQSQDNSTVKSEEVNRELYPLARLPSLDLKHTKFSYSSQDKPDEEMSIIDETNDGSNSPDIHQSTTRHLADLPDIYGDKRRQFLSDGSYDNTSYTSTDSISGHIIRTSRDEYQRRDSEHFSY